MISEIMISAFVISTVVISTYMISTVGISIVVQLWSVNQTVHWTLSWEYWGQNNKHSSRRYWICAIRDPFRPSSVKHSIWQLPRKLGNVSEIESKKNRWHWIVTRLIDAGGVPRNAIFYLTNIFSLPSAEGYFYEFFCLQLWRRKNKPFCVGVNPEVLHQIG